MKRIKENTHKALKWSEKYTKTDMVYLTKGGGWLGFESVASSIIGLISVILFANLLPKETFGSYKYILSFIGLLSIPTLLGMGPALAQAIARGFDGSFREIMRLKIRWGLLGTLASLIISLYYFFNNNNILFISFLILSVFIPFFNTYNIYISILQGKKDFKFQSLSNFYSNLIATGILISVLFLTQNIFILLLTHIISWTILRFIFLKLTLKRSRLNKKKDPSTVRNGFQFSIFRVLDTISSNLDKILLWHFLGAAQVAIYFLAITIPSKLGEFSKIFQRIAFPKLANREISEVKETLLPKIFKLTLGFLIIVILYIIFAPLIFKIIFPQYTDSVFYSQLLSLTVLAQPVMIINTFLSAKVRIKEMYYVNLTIQFIKIALFIIFIPMFGILGAIIALLMFNLFKSLLLILFFKKILN